MSEKTGIAAVVDLLDRQFPKSVADRALRAVGLSRHLLKNEPGFIPLSHEAVLLEVAARTVGERHLGLVLGAQHAYTDLGWYAKYVLSARSLAGAMARGKRALTMMSPGCAVCVRDAGLNIVLSYDFNLQTLNGLRHMEEGIPSLLIDLVRRFAGDDWSPEWVEMPGRADRRSDALELCFGAPVHFGSDLVGLALGKDILANRKIVSPDAASDITLTDLPNLIGVRPLNSVSDRVLALLPTQLELGDCSIDAVAARLSLGTRTLGRQLQAEGTSFRDLKQSFLRDRSIGLLETGQWSIREVALSLGYHETNSFRRAFQKWTGRPPGAYARHSG